MKRIPLVLIGMLLAACGADTVDVLTTPRVTAEPAVTLTPTRQLDAELVQLAEAFMALRGIPGHFGGGEPNEVVDKWAGQKHTLMLELGDRLGNGDFGRSEIIALIGPPDHVVTEGAALYENIESLPTFSTFAAADEFLVYEWRGTHDFLFFAVGDGRVLGADWWYAGE